MGFLVRTYILSKYCSLLSKSNNGVFDGVIKKIYYSGLLPSNRAKSQTLLVRYYTGSSEKSDKCDKGKPGYTKITINKSEPTEKPTEILNKAKPIIQVIAPNLQVEVKQAASNIENVIEKSLHDSGAIVPTSASTDNKDVKLGKDSKAKVPDIKKTIEDAKTPTKPETTTTTKKQRKRIDYAVASLERNFITPVRAMADFLLKPSDLEILPKTKRRSPYEHEPPITVYWRSDVKVRALELWGNEEKLTAERMRREIDRKKYQQNIFTVKRRLRDYRREMGRTAEATNVDAGLMGRSGKVVLMAIGINATNFVFKLGAWILTGSHTYGIHKSIQVADSNHPYGYANMKYVASLISGVGIFCVGAGLSVYHGISGLVDPQPITDLFWGYCVLGGSLISEGATWYVAFMSVLKGSRACNMSFKDYIFRGQDPSVNVVLLEDAAAVLGVTVAAGCMGLSSVYNSHIPDAIGSILVGGILGSVASFIIYTNVAALVGRSIPQENLSKMNTELEADVMIRAIHDVKGIDMGNFLVRYKAEVDFDGKELTRSYLETMELNALLAECEQFKTIDDVEEFMLKHGEILVDLLGGEIDRIEMKLRKKFPEIRHCDLEIL